MTRSLIVSTFLSITLLLSAGCATKQFVLNRTTPIDDRLAEVGERSNTNSELKVREVGVLFGPLHELVNRIERFVFIEASVIL